MRPHSLDLFGRQRRIVHGFVEKEEKEEEEEKLFLKFQLGNDSLELRWDGAKQATGVSVNLVPTLTTEKIIL